MGSGFEKRSEASLCDGALKNERAREDATANDHLSDGVWRLYGAWDCTAGKFIYGKEDLSDGAWR